jgi:predicted ATPase
VAKGPGVIEHIEIEGFKSLEKVSLDLGALNIFVGTNASGKSNFLEALRVLQGIGYGYTIDEIFNGKPKGANSEVWEGVRGGSKYAGFRRSRVGASIVGFRVRVSFPDVLDAVHYAIGVSKYGFVNSERLAVGDRVLYDLGPEQLSPGNTRPILSADPIDPEIAGMAARLRKQLSDVQALDPAPAVQREYARASGANRMGDHGDNFAALIKTIKTDDVKAAAYESWLKELTPAELDEVVVRPGAAGDWMFALRKDGVNYPAPVLSEGTLRFAAIAAAFFQPSLPQTLILEEIENGLHPTRLRLLVELLKSQAGKGISQVMATSHSPYAISWLKEDDYRTVFLCAKNAETGATSITPFSSIPRLMELARTQPIADLFAEGWLESAI